MVKDFAKKITLAIGDGANDVSMIQKADIGVGIVGKEGTQAALAADFSFGKFRFLKRLLLVHGRWSYWRFSNLVLYMFYKQLLGVILNLWFMFFNEFSGLPIFNSTLSLGYVLIFTSFPIGAFAILDRDLPAQILMEFPQVYREGQNNVYVKAYLFQKKSIYSNLC